jgi:hypothetical protein
MSEWSEICETGEMGEMGEMGERGARVRVASESGGQRAESREDLFVCVRIVSGAKGGT